MFFVLANDPSFLTDKVTLVTVRKVDGAEVEDAVGVVVVVEVAAVEAVEDLTDSANENLTDTVAVRERRHKHHGLG